MQLLPSSVVPLESIVCARAQVTQPIILGPAVNTYIILQPTKPQYLWLTFRMRRILSLKTIPQFAKNGVV